MFLNRFLESKNTSKNWNLECAHFLTRLASFGHLGLISKPLMVLKFYNKILDPKGQANKIDTIVKDREEPHSSTRCHIVPNHQL